MDTFKKTDDLNFTGSFCEGITLIVFCSQIFGILPLQGIRKKRLNQVHFTWTSMSCFLCLLVMVWDAIMICSIVYEHRNENFRFGILVTEIFFLMGVCTYGLFLKLAMQFGRVFTTYTALEQTFLKLPYVTSKSKKLQRKLNSVGIMIAVLSAGEHLLFVAHNIYVFVQKTIDCGLTNRGAIVFLTEHFGFSQKLIQGIIPLILSQIVSTSCTAAWNFLDLFIILISIGISTRFEQHTEALEKYLKRKHKIPKNTFAKDMFKFRADYLEICDLLAYVNDQFGLIIFLSATNDVFFVCNQILNAFNPKRYLFDRLYFLYSSFYMIGRTLYLFMSAASIHEKAQGPKPFLYNLPSNYWTEDCERLLHYINISKTALSASGFYDFTRGVILSMAGAIVTFELIMLQYEINSDSKLEDLCD